ncbi:glycosyltransferase [Brevibacterium litoralis]|uniref:glycosyltransferase n=1 Tax=Brevibacterium litoralis TaxID=3138935 RepID=UPI0032EFFA41
MTDSTDPFDLDDFLVPTMDEGQAELAEMLAESVLLDADWYGLQRGTTFETMSEAAVDYVLNGAEAGLTPHALFAPQWILRDFEGEYRWTEVLREHLTDPAYARRTATHPFFDPTRLPPRFAQAKNPLAEFLASATSSTPLPYDLSVWGHQEPVTLGQVQESARASWHTRSAAEAPSAPLTPIDATALGAPTSGSSLTFVVVLEDSPNDFRRAYEQIAGPRSVQRFGAWEMLVVDPYRAEDASVVVGHIAARDPRVKFLGGGRGDWFAGIASALEQAEGSAVVFAHPDLVWEERFAVTALAAIQAGTTALVSADADGTPLFDSLEGATLAGLAVETGEMRRVWSELDSTLGRAAVVAAVADLSGGTGQLPALSGGSTAATAVPEGPVRRPEDRPEFDRVLDIMDSMSDAPEEGSAEYVRVVLDTRLSRLEELVAGLGTEPSTDRATAVIGVLDSAWPTVQMVDTVVDSLDGVGAVIGPDNKARVLNRVLRRNPDAVMAVSDFGQWLVGTDERFGEILEEIKTSGTPVHPLTVDEDHVIAEAGSFYPGRSIEPSSLLNGVSEDAVSLTDGTELPSAGLPLMFHSADVLDVGGFDAALDDLWLGEDLCRRLPTGSPVLSTNLTMRPGGPSPAPRKDRASAIAAFRAGWSEAEVPRSEQLLSAWDVTPFPQGSEAWAAPAGAGDQSTCAWVPGRFQTHDRASTRRWLILPRRSGEDIDGPAGSIAFAHSLARSLRTAGQTAVVQDARSTTWTLQDADVVLDLDGAAEQPIPPGSVSILWATGDVDRIDPARLRNYDSRFAAAPVWTQRIGERLGIEVDPLLLCTDPQAFPFDPGTPFNRENKVVSVGDRKPWRQISVHGSLQDLPKIGYFSVHGNGWTGRIPGQFVAPYPGNVEDLADLYRRSFYVVLDHRPELRDLGYVSRQVFDVLSAGGHLLVDDVHGLHDLFDGHVAVYRNRTELSWAFGLEWVCYYPTPEGQRKLSERIAREHSFTRRAGTLIEAADALLR